MTDLTPEFLAELRALADEARLPVHAFWCPASQAWDIPGICVCSPRHRKKMSVGIDTVRALVEGYERAQQYEKLLWKWEPQAAVLSQYIPGAWIDALQQETRKALEGRDD